MAAVDPKAVMELHRLTDLPVMRCKAALVEAGGDPAAAIEVLRRWSRPSRGGYVAASPGFWEQFDRTPPPAEPGSEADPHPPTGDKAS